MSPRPSVTRVAPAQDQISNISDIDNPTRERRSIEVDDPDFLVTKAEDADQGSVVEKLKLKSNSIYNLFLNQCFYNYIRVQILLKFKNDMSCIF